MNDADFALEWTENLKKETLNSKFQENDIRNELRDGNNKI